MLKRECRGLNDGRNGMRRRVAATGRGTNGPRLQRAAQLLGGGAGCDEVASDGLSGVAGGAESLDGDGGEFGESGGGAESGFLLPEFAALRFL